MKLVIGVSIGYSLVLIGFFSVLLLLASKDSGELSSTEIFLTVLLISVILASLAMNLKLYFSFLAKKKVSSLVLKEDN